MNGNGVALFGGSFNPIHFGHLIAARAIAEHLSLARAILLPAAYPPHKWSSELAPAEHRLAMTRLAVEGEPLLEASDVELRQGGINYSIRTVEAFRQELGGDVRLYWIIGGDTLPDLHMWHRIREMVDLCRIVTAVRPGFETPDLAPLLSVLSPQQVARIREGIISTPRVDISSTEIRWRIREGRSIRYLVPESVRAYIADHGLYRGT
ncbi:MAG: nicotinate (nicotinamide) nucleotide adenylyltransferase [Phycisphaerae bacterium]